MIRRVVIRHFRNINEAVLTELGRVNVFVGANGAGKTALLEALFTLAHGKSFRRFGGQKESLVQFTTQELTVVADIDDFESTGFGSGLSSAEAAPVYRVGLSKSRIGETKAKVRGDRVKRISDLALRLPVVAINSDTFDILFGGSHDRRAFLDWLVFHVEHDFFKVSRSYLRALDQRNAALRVGRHPRALSRLAPREALAKEFGGPLPIGDTSWIDQLAVLGERVNELRLGVFAALAASFNEMCLALGLGDQGLELRYKRGWLMGESLAVALTAAADVDSRRGFTGVGPHRADIQVISIVGGEVKLARDVLSRGQLKQVLVALKLAQMVVYREMAGTRTTSGDGGRSVSPVLLLDDVAAELDEERLSLLGSVLSELSAQVFLSATQLPLVAPLLEAMSLSADGGQVRVFHVEQGLVS